MIILFMIKSEDSLNDQSNRSFNYITIIANTMFIAKHFENVVQSLSDTRIFGGRS